MNAEMVDAEALKQEQINIKVKNPASNQYLSFILNNEEYAVDILRVQEIKGWDRATIIPNAPEYVKGVINLRGTIVPVVDLRCLFSLEKTQYTATTVVIVMNIEGEQSDRIMGIVVDAVSEVYSVDANAIRSAPDLHGNDTMAFVKGLANVGQSMLIILDVDKILNSNELAQEN